MKKITVKKNKDIMYSDSLSIDSGNGRKIRNHAAVKQERKQPEAVCNSEQALIEAVFDSVPGLLYLYTEDGRLIRWNKQHEEMTGYTSEELLNFRAEGWFDEKDRETLAREFPRVFSDGYSQAEMNVIMKNGRKVPYLLNGVRVKIDGKPHMVGIGVDISGLKKAEKEKEEAMNEVRRLKELLEAENVYLKKEMAAQFAYDDIIGKSDAMQYVLFRTRQVALTEATVLVMGETGTGKGRIARLIHQASQRKDSPMVMVNCAGLPGNLIESELFGREKGAFTGAEARQIGRFELADGGTIFLDEIAELPVELQAKLLRVIEDGEFERLGSPHTIKVDVRIIASTNRNLREQIGKGRFREDLFYRLNVFPITLPPLRQRKEDILLLAGYFSEKFSKQYGKKITEIPEKTLRILQAHAWPGNIRELMGVVERAVIVTNGPTLQLAEPIVVQEAVIQQEGQNNQGLADVEKDHIRRILGEAGWKIEGPNGAAKLLGLHPSTLRNRMKKLGIERPARLR